MRAHARSRRLSLQAPIITAAQDPGLAAHVIETFPLAGVTGGSALLSVGNRLLAVHDDAFRATWIALPSMVLTPLLLQGNGAPLPKHEKPDFESAVQTPDGVVHVLGSGAAPNRCAIARVDLRAGTIGVESRPDLYRCVQEALAPGAVPNVEGAVIEGERLLLFHRGIDTLSAIVELPVGVLYGAAARLLDARLLDLGAIHGVRLAFTDAARIARDLIAFAATAEDTPDAIADGPVVGSVIGLLDGAGQARWTPLVDRDDRLFLAKVEGLAVDAGGSWILTDADDPGTPAQLARVALRGFD